MLNISPQSFLAACAMTFIGGMGLLMCFHTVPASNHDFIVFILGALSGAITVTGAAKAVSAVTAIGPGTTVSNAAPTVPPTKTEPTA